MVVGMLLAGGKGERMGASIPKQFIKVNGKPIICYPLEIMEKHPRIDAVEIVCIDEYINKMEDLVNQYGYKKVRWITKGGNSAQDSIWNGLQNLTEDMQENDIIMIHMSSYPLASDLLIDQCIDSTLKYGNGCTAMPIRYSVYVTEDRKTSVKQIERDNFMLCTIPICFKYGECFDLYKRAYAEGKGITGNVFANTLYCDYGKRIYFTEDNASNVKITTPEDIDLMRAYLNILDEKNNNSLVQ